MTDQTVSSGLEPRTYGPERRALYDLGRRISALEANGTAGPAPSPPAWIAPTLLNGWQNLGAGWTVIGYRMIGDIVYLRGVPARSPATTTSPVFVLPATYRPPSRQIFRAVGDGGSGRIDVDVDGTVYAQSGWVPNTGWVAIDGIYFSVTS